VAQHRAAAANIRTRRVYDPPVAGEGERILVMRLWPRGIAKSKVDRWLRELAPVLPLMRGYRSGRIPWQKYRPQYLAGLERPEAQAHVEEILALAREGDVTLLCGCPDLARCHRSLLQEYLAERV
jgi:uncharacterized protein YeaO (DUF488 family)